MFGPLWLLTTGKPSGCSEMRSENLESQTDAKYENVEDLAGGRMKFFTAQSDHRQRT
jgi:hypothetical protein